MQSAILALNDALKLETMNCKEYDQHIPSRALGKLTALTAWLIEGDTEQKKFARKELHRLIAKGRRIDLQRATLQKQQQEQPE